MASRGKKNQHRPSLPTTLLGFLGFNGMFTAAIFFVILFLYAGIVYPRTVGLYFIVPYYTYSYVRAHEFKDGNHWQAFSQKYPPFRWMRSLLGLEFAHPLPQELVQAEKKPDAQFVIAIFPHGVASDYRILMDGILHDALPNVAHKCRTLAATVLFRLPFVRELALWTGCVDARRSVAQRILDEGRSILVCPGGEAEQIRTTKGKEILYLKNRKGFIKLAMRKGVPVVPCYAFGASDYYYTIHAFFSFRNWLVKNMGICIPLAVGMYGSPWCPLPIKTTLALGEPLRFSVNERGSPTQEELDAAHEQFCVAIRQVFDEHKHRLGYGDRTLELV